MLARKARSLDAEPPMPLTEPVILQRHIEPDEAHYRLYLPPDLVYFRGHFPDHPVLPGVVQLRWAIELARPLGLGGEIKIMERLKFSRLMVPGLELMLTIKRSSRPGIDFRFHDADGSFSSGRLLKP